MAATDFGALTTSRKKVWSAKVLQAGRDNSFFFSKGFVGDGQADATKPIHLITELTKTSKGDQCVIPLVLDLSGDGVAGDNELTGNEEALINDDLTVTVDQIRNGVKSKGRMAEQRVVLNFRNTARDSLSFWLGDKLDEMMFLMASGLAFTYKTDRSTRPANSQLPNLAFAADVSAPSANRGLYGSGTGTASIVAGDTMAWDMIVRANTVAKRRRLKPLRMGGKEYYCIVMSPEQERSLKTDTNYRTTLQNAGERGQTNPLFTGAFAVVDGTILYSHPKVTNTYGLASSSKWGSGGTVDGAEALLLGAQALAIAMIGDAAWDEETTDHGARQAVSYGQMVGFKKTKFKSLFDAGASEDFATLAIHTAAAQAT